MTFNKLDGEELAKVVEFFAVDIDPADPENGATKKELLAALAAGDEPVTWEQYKTIYLPTVATLPEPPVSPEPEPVEVVVVAPQPVAEENVYLVMERENPRFEIYGYTFTKDHPFRPVTEEAAEFILSHAAGFRIALPREIKEYYS